MYNFLHDFPPMQVLLRNSAEKLNLHVTQKGLIMREDFANDSVTQGFRCVVWWIFFFFGGEGDFIREISI